MDLEDNASLPRRCWGDLSAKGRRGCSLRCWCAGTRTLPLHSRRHEPNCLPLGRFPRLSGRRRRGGRGGRVRPSCRRRAGSSVASQHARWARAPSTLSRRLAYPDLGLCGRRGRPIGKHGRLRFPSGGKGRGLHDLLHPALGPHNDLLKALAAPALLHRPTTHASHGSGPGPAQPPPKAARCRAAAVLRGSTGQSHFRWRRRLRWLADEAPGRGAWDPRA